MSTLDNLVIASSTLEGLAMRKKELDEAMEAYLKDFADATVATVLQAGGLVGLRMLRRKVIMEIRDYRLNLEDYASTKYDLERDMERIELGNVISFSETVQTHRRRVRLLEDEDEEREGAHD